MKKLITALVLTLIFSNILIGCKSEIRPSNQTSSVTKQTGSEKTMEEIDVIISSTEREISEAMDTMPTITTETVLPAETAATSSTTAPVFTKPRKPESASTTVIPVVTESVDIEIVPPTTVPSIFEIENTESVDYPAESPWEIE